MTFNEYQIASRRFCRYPDIDNNVIYPVLGLMGEAGEIADKFQHIIRDYDQKMSPEMQAGIVKEMGDVLWFMSQLASEMKVSLEDVAQGNIAKLSAREDKGLLHGHGDDREAA